MQTVSLASFALWLAAPLAAQSVPALSISPDALRADLSVIASEKMEGRNTPSPGLDAAAAYIAAQFRHAGLEPAADRYLQTAKMLRVGPLPDGFVLRIASAARVISVSPDQVTVVSRRAIEFSHEPVYKRNGTFRIGAPHPVALLETAEPESPAPKFIEAGEDLPRIALRDPAAIAALLQASEGDTGIAVSLKLPAPNAEPFIARNVAALLPGSDPASRAQYLLVTAHYDHLGRNSAGDVFPGANDDASGVVSLLAIAKALAALPVHPKRSIVFLAFFGEEEGNLGSRYYARHPLFRLANTIADLNLEQLGRTDSNLGPQIAAVSVTGFSYSTVSDTLRQAGAATGVKVEDVPNNEDYFERSDNQTFAEQGIPAHTIAVAFDFPDYHAAGDTWQKIDYANMAKVDRMIAQAVVDLADSPAAPAWNRGNPKVARFRSAAGRAN